MDEVLEAAELLEDSGMEGLVTWLFRIVGAVLILAGLGLWLLTESGLLVLPALLLVAGLILVAAPSILLLLAELS